MSGIEIRERINENNARIQAALDRFVLNEEIRELMKENDKIRAQCNHSFIDGVCEYCDGFEGAIYDD
jgi:hypothetical protein